MVQIPFFLIKTRAQSQSSHLSSTCLVQEHNAHPSNSLTRSLEGSVNSCTSPPFVHLTDISVFRLRPSCTSPPFVHLTDVSVFRLRPSCTSTPFVHVTDVSVFRLRPARYLITPQPTLRGSVNILSLPRSMSIE